MKTRNAILDAARLAFNARGLAQVTLRDIAADMGRAYGNITYHFPTKEALVKDLYAQLVEGLQAVSRAFAMQPDLLDAILAAPRQTFGLSLKFLFFYRDFLDVVRGFPDVAAEIKRANLQRMEALRAIFQQMQATGYLDPELNPSDLDYIMELSGAVRTIFFQQLTVSDWEDARLEDRYVDQVNRLLYPYLTDQGKARFKAFAAGG